MRAPLSLTPLLSPRHVAVVGASPDRARIRGRLLHVLRSKGFAGAVHAVNPSYEHIGDLPCHPSVDAIGEPVDAALIAVPGDRVLDELRRCAQAGVKAAIVYSSLPPGAQADQAAIRRLAQGCGMQVLGPGSQGLLNAIDGVPASFSSTVEFGPAVADYPRPDAQGRVRTIAVVSQSGGMGFGILKPMLARGLRVSHVVATGAEAVLDTCSVARALVAEGRTGVLILICEHLPGRQALVDLAQAAAGADVPVVLYKAGRTAAAARAAQSHSGSAAAWDAGLDALLSHLGVVRAEDPDDAVDLAAALSHARPAAGPRVGIVSFSGGAGVTLAESCELQGLAVPPLSDALQARIAAVIPSLGSAQNPVDVTAQAVESGGFAAAASLLQASGEVDLVVASISVAREGPILEAGTELARMAADPARPPVLFYSNAAPNEAAIAALRDFAYPFFFSVRPVARAAAALPALGAARRRLPQRLALMHGTDPADAERAAQARRLLEQAGDLLCEHEAQALLALYGIRTPRGELADTLPAGRAAAGRIGYPVVLKVQSPDIPHKTDAGAVAIGIRNAGEFEAAWSRILANSQRAVPHARIHGVLVQQLLPTGVDMLAGVVFDEQCGPTLVAGYGGVHVEVFADLAYGATPLSTADAQDLVGRLRSRKLLQGVRGAPASDEPAYVQLCVALSRLAHETAGLVAELDLNPVRVLPGNGGAIAADALVVRRQPKEAA